MPRKKKKDAAVIGVKIKHNSEGNIKGMQLKGVPERMTSLDPETGDAEYVEASKYENTGIVSMPAPILILKRVLAAEGRVDNKVKALNKLFNSIKGTLSRTVEAEEFAYRRCETELELLKLKKQQLQDHMDEIDKQIELKGSELVERRAHVDNYMGALKDLQVNKNEDNSK